MYLPGDYIYIYVCVCVCVSLSVCVYILFSDCKHFSCLLSRKLNSTEMSQKRNQFLTQHSEIKDISFDI